MTDTAARRRIARLAQTIAECPHLRRRDIIVRGHLATECRECGTINADAYTYSAAPTPTV